jgi:SNF2 family DNA or RNA helicase
MAFIDEAQFVKNFRSKAAHALRKIDARSIVCLTGTPLENYLEDLWALFDLIFPGLFGYGAEFQRRLRGPSRAERPRRVNAKNPPFYAEAAQGRSAQRTAGENRDGGEDTHDA